MSGVRIRVVRADDVPRVVELVRDVLAEFGLVFGVGSGTDEDVLRLPDAYERVGGRFWVAEDGAGALCGTCGVYPIDAATLELRKMYAHPRARGRGVGRRLLDESIRFARERGARHVVLDTIDEMDSAIRLYERAGFVRDDAQIRGARCSRGYRLDL